MRPTARGGDTRDLRTWWRRLARRSWVVVACALLGAAAGVAWSQVHGPSYTADTTVLVDPPLQLANGLGRGVVLLEMDDELAYAQTLRVATEALQLMRSPTELEPLRAGLFASVPANTSILRFEYTASTPALAVEGADAYAGAYLTLRDLETAQAHSKLLSELTAQTTAAQRQLDTFTAQAASTTTDPAARAYAVAQTPVLQNRLASLIQRVEDLTVGGSGYGSVVDPASPPTAPSSPPSWVLVSGCVLGGLLAGVLGALLLISRERRVRTAAEIPARTGLAVLQEVRSDRRRVRPGLAGGRAAADVDRVRLRLTGDRLDPARSVLVCSDHAGPAAGYLAANLTAAHVRAGRVVVLVCASTTSPAPRILGVDDSGGLAALLTRGEPLESAAAPVPSMRTAHALAAGPDLDLGSEGVTAGGVAAVADALVRSGACVVVEGPGPASDPATLELARHAHSCALVVELGVSTVADVRAAAVELMRAGVLSVAVVVVPRLRGEVEAPLPGAGGAEPHASAREPVNA